MPASIFEDKFVERESRTPAWHGLGTVFTEKLTVSEAVEKAGVGFEVYKTPNYTRIPVRDDWGNDTGQFEYIETNSFSIGRDATWAERMNDESKYIILSATAGKQWTPIQAKVLGQMLDPLTNYYDVETVGAIGKGGKVFITLNAGGAEIASEDHDLYYLITDHRDGKGSLTIAFTPVRVVCQNTLTMAIRDSRISVTLQHRQSIEEDAKFWTGAFNKMITADNSTLNRMEHAKDSTINKMNSLTSINISEAEARSVIDLSYPEPAPPKGLRMTKDWVPSAEMISKELKNRGEWLKEHGNAIENMQNLKNMAFERYDIFNQEHSKVAQTPWAIWQAIVETEDFRRGKEKNNSRQSASLFGGRAKTKEKAFDEALKLVTAN